MNGAGRQRLEEVALSVLHERESLDYRELAERAERSEVETLEQGEGAALVQVEVQYLFDSGRSGPVRIIVSVDDGGWRAFVPLTRDTIVAPVEGEASA